MAQHQSTNSGLHELAPSYAIGALDENEREAFEAHLRQGCPGCEAELRSLYEVTDELAELAAADPPPTTRARLMDRVRSIPRSAGILIDAEGLLISRSAELAWLPFASGIAYKPLFNDTGRRYGTSLVRMEAGARFPSHRHKDVEELFMLSGDLHVAGEVMRTGDYCRAGTDTLHSETFSESGCLFLLLASQDNEIVT